MSTTGSAAEAKNDAKEAVGMASDRAKEAVDRGTNIAGDVAERSAEELRHYADRADRAVDSVAGTADDAAKYMHDADADTLVSDATSYVKRHPLQATVVALVLGFLLARMFSR